MSYDLNYVMDKIKNNDPSVIYLRDIRDCHLWYDGEFRDENIQTYTYQNLINQTVKSVIFRHQIVIVDNWDKNGVYYNLDKVHFPNAKIIVMNSHPCEYSTLTRSPDWKWVALYNHRWFNEFDNIQVVRDVDLYKNLIKTVLHMDRKYTANLQGKLVRLENNFLQQIYNSIVKIFN